MTYFHPIRHKKSDHANPIRKSAVLPIGSEVTIVDYEENKFYDGVIKNVFLGSDQDQLYYAVTFGKDKKHYLYRSQAVRPKYPHIS